MWTAFRENPTIMSLDRCCCFFSLVFVVHAQNSNGNSQKNNMPNKNRKLSHTRINTVKYRWMEWGGKRALNTKKNDDDNFVASAKKSKWNKTISRIAVKCNLNCVNCVCVVLLMSNAWMLGLKFRSICQLTPFCVRIILPEFRFVSFRWVIKFSFFLCLSLGYSPHPLSRSKANTRLYVGSRGSNWAFARCVFSFIYYVK